MNKQRRKALDDLAIRLEALGDEIETLQGEEQDYFDNMPEGLQASEKGQAAEEACCEMDEAGTCIADAALYLRTAAK